MNIRSRSTGESTKSINIQRIETYVLRYPLSTPVQTSFGLMLDRPMVLLCVTNIDGQQGWGKFGVTSRLLVPSIEKGWLTTFWRL